MTEETNHKTYKLGLALSGGGAKGFAHIGVFKLLEECGLKPDIIVGTSVGSLMGALFADGYTSDEIKDSLRNASSPSSPSCKSRNRDCSTASGSAIFSVVI